MLEQKEHPIYKKLLISKTGEIFSKSMNKLKLYERQDIKKKKFLYLQFSIKGKQFKKKVRDLVMETYGEQKDITVNLDKNYKNNDFENLKSFTYQEYIKYIYPNVKIKLMIILGNEYYICSNGEVFSTIYEIFLNKYLDRRGYYYYSFRNKDSEKKIKAHRLVALAFIPNPENKKLVNHKDLNQINNEDYNLEWATNQENVIHAIINKGIINKFRKKVQMIKNKEVIKTFDSLSEAAKYVGGTAINVSRAAKSDGKKIVKGYNWRLVE